LKKNIGILEYHYHTKYLFTKAKIVKTKDTNVTIFTTKNLYNKLKVYIKNISDYDIVLKDEKESISSFLKKVKNICNERIDLLFVNTIQETLLDLPHFLNFKPSCKMVLTIHSVNSWFKKTPEINYKKIVKSIDTTINSYLTKKILKNFNAINVIYPPIKKNILKEYHFKKPIYTLPFGFYNKELASKQTKRRYNEILFVIPGQIEEHRRDYDFVLRVFKKIFEKNKEKIRLILLGFASGRYGTQIINKCIKMQEKGYKINFYEKYVPEEEFNIIMKNADFLILPIKIQTYGLGARKEYYGKTKGSAAVFEAIQYAKPLIVPDEFEITKDMSKSILRYKNQNDFENKISKLINDVEEIKKYKKNALINSEKFSIDSLQKYFTEEILNKIDNI